MTTRLALLPMTGAGELNCGKCPGNREVRYWCAYHEQRLSVTDGDYARLLACLSAERQAARLVAIEAAARRVVEAEDALGRLIDTPTLATDDAVGDAMGDAGSAMIALREALKEV